MLIAFQALASFHGSKRKVRWQRMHGVLLVARMLQSVSLRSVANFFQPVSVYNISWSYVDIMLLFLLLLINFGRKWRDFRLVEKSRRKN